jgi:hypothetical protein
VSAYNFTTIDDVAPHMQGVVDWIWGGSASFDDFCQWVWENHEKYAYMVGAFPDTELRDVQTAEMLEAYLVSVDENPTDYDL